MNNQVIKDAEDIFHPGVSIDCVILGFDEGNIKILLRNIKGVGAWSLPGGFPYKEEDLDIAASRILEAKTGLSDIFLRQFHVFGNAHRIDVGKNREVLTNIGVEDVENHWTMRRFVSVGYYALVHYKDSIVKSEFDDVDLNWFDLKEIPSLYSDHNRIVQIAIESIRMQLGYIPIGYGLLPEKFTMPELRTIYETILGKSLDRRNFQRKMLSVGLVKKLPETRREGAHKAPILYSFVKEKYDLALEYGMQLMPWSSRDL